MLQEFCAHFAKNNILSLSKYYSSSWEIIYLFLTPILQAYF